jgi:hypothetical protein
MGLGVKRPVRRADSLATFMRRLSENLGALTSRNVQGLFYLYLYDIRINHGYFPEKRAL